MTFTLIQIHIIYCLFNQFQIAFFHEENTIVYFTDNHFS